MTKAELNEFLIENFEEVSPREINTINPYGMKFINNENQLKNWIEDMGLMPDYQEWFKKYPGKNNRDQVFLLFLSSYQGGKFATLYKNYPKKNIKAIAHNVGYRSLSLEVPCKALLKKLGFTIVEASIYRPGVKPFHPIIFMDTQSEDEYQEALMKYAEAVNAELEALKTEEENL